MLTKKLTEKQFQDQVIQLAKLFGWLVYHTYDSRRSVAGFPDLILLRRGEMIVAELKVGKNKPSTDQNRWLNEFGLVSEANVFVWYPEHWDLIQARLS